MEEVNRVAQNRFFCLLSATVLVAQVTTSQIVGTVLDAQGTVVPGAQITAQNEQTEQTITTKSDQVGSYKLSALPTGFYTVRVESAGFKQFVRKVSRYLPVSRYETPLIV